MLKRFLISRLLLASTMVWLVHSMVPHHHHGEEICFKTHHCHESACETGYSVADTGQCHGHQDNPDHCMLRQITFLPASQHKVLGQQVQVLSNPVMAIIPDPEDPGPRLGVKHWRYLTGSPPPLIILSHTSCALRAPPIV